MRVKKMTLDWVDILLNGTYWVFYSKVDYMKLETDSDSDNLAGDHWRYTSPLFARTRRISIEGYVDNLGNDKELEAIKHLQSIFRLQAYPWGAIIPRKLYIKDIHDRERIMDVKISDPFYYIETDDDFRDYSRSRRVELESIKDPRYYSLEEFMHTLSEFDNWGFTMDFSMENSWDEYSSIMILETEGNTNTPLRFEIDVVHDFEDSITIRNITTNQTFKLNVDGTVWDKIIIDTGLYTVTKNNINVIGNREPDSDRITINWSNTFAIYTADGNSWLSDLDVKVFYREVML